MQQAERDARIAALPAGVRPALRHLVRLADRKLGNQHATKASMTALRTDGHPDRLAFIQQAEEGANVRTLAERFKISHGSTVSLFDELLLARKVTPRTNRQRQKLTEHNGVLVPQPQSQEGISEPGGTQQGLKRPLEGVDEMLPATASRGRGRGRGRGRR